MSDNSIYQNFVRRKRFDQIFLLDRSTINDIITAINPQPGQIMVEIGPGLGALTKPIIQIVDTMTVIEIDRSLVKILASHPCFKSRLNIEQKNAIKVDFAILYAKLGQQPLRIFGNLPYNISTPLIFHLFNYSSIIKDMHFMLQKEVVNRLVANPNSKAYGKLSIMAQYYCQITSVLEVPPTSFYPIPKVDSAMVRLIPYNNEKSPFLVKDLSKLIALTNVAFSQRRKMLHNSLSDFFSAKQLKEHGIDSTLRAENLSIKHYCYLANLLT